MRFMEKAKPSAKLPQEGLTLIELLVVTAIIAFLAVIFFLYVIPFLQKSRDGVRKAHLEKYRIALEEYREDRGVYPESTALNNCGGEELMPYLDQIYCDPSTKLPYRYVPSADRSSYSLYSNLLYTDDPIISSIGCESGCGPDDDENGSGDYNYGLNAETNNGQEPPSELSPTCGTAPNYFCYANVCSICCPGSGYRCNGTGTGCLLDERCQ
jgi:prepilin-type N-terminal cleavage/methylation domain-containing protein